MGYTLIEALNDIQNAFKRKNIIFLRKISDKCTETALIEENKAFIQLSVISYVLAKIMEKPRFSADEKQEDFVRKIEKSIEKGIEYVKEGRMDKFSYSMELIFKEIKSVDIKHRRFVHNIIEKAEIKVASRLYAQGLSLGSASALTGVDKKDILNYIGKTIMIERSGRTKSITERLKNARRIFS